MCHWKIIRDQKKRGHTKDQIMASIMERQEDAKKYVSNQIKNADVIVEVFPDKKIHNLGDEQESFNLNYNLQLSNDTYLEPLIRSLETIETLNIVHQYGERDHQILSLTGTCSEEIISRMAQKYVLGLDDLGITNPVWPSGLFGVVTLILTYHIFHKAEYDRK